MTTATIPEIDVGRLIEVDLDGESGNVFVIIGRVVSYLRDTGHAELVSIFIARAQEAGSYEALLRIADGYAPIWFHRRGRPVNLFGLLQ